MERAIWKYKLSLAITLVLQNVSQSMWKLISYVQPVPGEVDTNVLGRLADIEAVDIIERWLGDYDWGLQI